MAPCEAVLQALTSCHIGCLGANVLFHESGLDLLPDGERKTDAAGEDDQMAWHSLTGGPLDAPTPVATATPGMDTPAPTPATGMPAVDQLGGLSLDEYLRRVEAECIASALTASGGNKSRAARLLGIKRSTLGDRIVRCGLERVDAQGGLGR